MNFSKLSSLILLLPVAACSHTSSAPEARNAPSAVPEAQDAPPSALNGSYAQAPGEAAAEPPPPSAPNGSYSRAPSEAAPKPAAPSPVNGAGLDRAQSASAAPASRSAQSGGAYQPQPDKAEKKDDRPGLGTTWGETRTSYVSNQAFERADFSHPFALLALNYNDAAGVQAMARRDGNAYGTSDGSNVEVAQGAITVQVLDENGSPLPSQKIGARNYVVGSDGQRYTIHIQNHTGTRFEALATVDGLDVIDGKAGSFVKRGYLVNPWATLEIDGFRRSQAAVAAFRFGAVKDSYAARKGDDRNVGVIGVAFFHERGSSFPWTERELQRRASANPFPGFAEPPPAPLVR
ncbi:MAG: hypothetical protein ABJB12_14660 [Pseudomonadota bacterium]